MRRLVIVDGQRPREVDVAPGEEDQPVIDAPPRPRLDVSDFRRRFTLAERMAITTRAEVSMRSDPPDATLRVFLDDLNANTFVYLDDPEVAGVLDYLEALGLIAPGRKAEVLAP